MAVSGRFASMVLQFTSALVIARLLAPAEFGLFGIATSVVAISASLREFGITGFLVRLEVLDREALGRAFAFTMSISFTCGIAIFLARGEIAEYFHDPRLANLIGIQCATFVLNPPTVGANAVLSRQMRFGLINLIQVSITLAALLLTLTLATLGFGATSLAAGQVFQSTLLLICLTVVDWRNVLVWPVFSGLGAMFRFGSFAAMSGAVGQIGNYVTSLVLGRLLGPAAVGYYDRGNGLFVAITDLVTAVGNVLFVGIAKARTDSAEMATLVLRAMRNLTAVIWSGFLLLAALSGPLIEVMFGAKWRPAVEVLQILCLSGIMMSGYVLLFQTLVAMGATGRIFAIEATGQGTRVLAVLGLARLGVLGAAAASVVSTSLLFALYLSVAHRYIRAHRRDVTATLIQSLGIAVFTALPPALLVRYDPLVLPAFAHLVVGGLLGVALWLCAIFALRHDMSRELRAAAAQAWAKFGGAQQSD